MAKGQKRSTREVKKPAKTDTKNKGGKSKPPVSAKAGGSAAKTT